MGIISSVQKTLGFTRNELRALLFLSATFTLGIGIRWFKAIDTPDPVRFDYSALDSVFSARSQAVLQEPEKPAQPSKKRPRKQLQPGSVNINTATREELMLLPGIGETYAERILLYRESHGPFSSHDQLLEVKGIGKKKLDRMREYLAPVDSSVTK